MSDTSWHNIYQLQMHNILQVASISIAAENVHFTELRLLLSELCVKSNSALWSAVLTNITEVHETVLADIHARSLLWQFYFHMHWTIFCTHAKYKYLCHNILHVMFAYTLLALLTGEMLLLSQLSTVQSATHSHRSSLCQVCPI